MNTPPHSSADATPEPLQPENFDATLENSSVANGQPTNGQPTNGQTINGQPINSWEAARAELNAFLGDDGETEPTVFDEAIVDSDETADDSTAEYLDTEWEEATEYEENDDDKDDQIYAEGYVEPRGSRWPGMLFFVLLIGGIGGGALYYKTKANAREARRWAPIAMPDKMALVPTDWGMETLAQKLKKSDKIRDVDAFVESAKDVGLTNVTPGGYALPEKAGPRDLAGIFKAGPTHEKVVIPPGFTGVQIVARLKNEGFQGADDMEKLIYPDQGFSSYEGTLGPDTYWMPVGADGKTLIAQMQEEFASMMKKLPEPLPIVKGKPLTKSEIVTIASLVERESNLKDEMPIVAGVMVNRLEKGMRLQIDASVQYARILADKDHKTRLYFKDYKFESPFNTYLHDGLPPTPICNPGTNALMAAARPAKTSALFYVYSPKLKKHIFANDFSGHKDNVAKARRERAALEANG